MRDSFDAPGQVSEATAARAEHPGVFLHLERHALAVTPVGRAGEGQRDPCPGLVDLVLRRVHGPGLARVMARISFGVGAGIHGSDPQRAFRFILGEGSHYCGQQQCDHLQREATHRCPPSCERPTALLRGSAIVYHAPARTVWSASQPYAHRKARATLNQQLGVQLARSPRNVPVGGRLFCVSLRNTPSRVGASGHAWSEARRRARAPQGELPPGLWPPPAQGLITEGRPPRAQSLVILGGLPVNGGQIVRLTMTLSWGLSDVPPDVS